MDLPSLKRARAPFRRQITKLCKSLKDETSKVPLDVNKLNADLKLLLDQNAKLLNLDEQILMHITREQQDDEEGALDPDDDEEEDEDAAPSEVDKEFDKAYEYQREVTYVTTMLDTLLAPRQRPASPSSTSSFSTAVGGAPVVKKTTYKLPKKPLRKFNGQLSDWLSFWSHFEKIHTDDEYHAVDKFDFLVDCMVPGTRAWELVESFPVTAANYPEVIAALKERYGRDDLLIPHYIRGILKLAIQNATSKEKVPLSSLYDKLEKDIRSLGTLNVTTKEMERFLHPIVEACLDEDVCKAWQRSHLYDKDGSTENPVRTKLDYLLQFLREESNREMKRQQAREDFTWGSNASDQPKNQTKPKKSKSELFPKEELPTAAGLSTQLVNNTPGCIFCGKKNHPSDHCFRAKRMSLKERESKVREEKACFSCLNIGHMGRQCKAPLCCSFCGDKHFELMCRKLEALKLEQGSTQNSSNQADKETTAASLGVQCIGDVLLKTVLVKMKNPVTGKECKARLVFDDCSHRTFGRKRKLIQVNSRPVSSEESRVAMIDGSLTEYKKVNRHEVIITGLAPGSKPQKVLVREQEKIGCPIPKIPPGKWMEKLKKEGIKISDLDGNHGLSEIDILLGSDYYESFRTGRRIHVADRLYAVETILGWTLSGPLPKEDGVASEITHSYFSGEIEKLWDLETLGIRDSADHETKAEHDERVKVNFQNEITQNPDGRYVVKLPFINGEPTNISNYEVCLKRLTNTVKKLKEQDMYDAYMQVFEDWEKKGIVEKVPVGELQRGVFSPHRPVIKMESATTPIRPVMDASCRVGKLPSLNMLLETGPNLLELLVSLLLTFRRHGIGAISDIEKAFLQILVDITHRNYQKFLLWDDGANQPVEYRFTRVVFGMTCSPFILAAVLEHHLKKFQNDTAKVLLKSLYVDNYVGSFPSEVEYVKFKEEATALLEKAKMNLRQWESNCDPVHEKEETSVLGVIWNKKQDTLSLKRPKMKLEPDDNVTNRKVLSLIAQVFDPIGVSCPAVLQAKLMLQRNTGNKKWDESWTDEEKETFMKWYAEMEALIKISVPRFAYRNYLNPEDKMQMHMFVDASKSSYACCAFIRTENGNDDVSVQLLLAKSRVAPLEKKNKKITIPRLELLACFIGSRLLATILEVMEEQVPVFLWSDSSACIAWITREEIWGVFVQNRVNEIRRLTNPVDWRHIPGISNPADLPSRGCSPEELLQSRWWEGPGWLQLPESEWPVSPVNVNEDEVMKEKRKTEVACFAAEKVEPPFSHYWKNARVYAWRRRYIDNLKKKVKKEELTLSEDLTFQELRQGEYDMLLEIQQKHFVEKPDVKGFNVKKYEDGSWRLETRLTYRKDKENFKYPMILPGNDPLVEQLVRYVHQTSKHCGPQYVLGKLRERYWIIHGRTLVKKIIHKCVKCQRYRVESMKVEPAPLPANRVDTGVAFQTTGIDLAGPLYVAGGGKAWIVLYTCAVYRCVHLDLVDSLSTEAFLFSLERFVNTVGRPNTIYTDNGTNFVGATNLFKKLNWKRITKATGTEPMKWVFIPPSAPWWGGWWERLVRSVKGILKKMLGKAKLKYEELRTCLASVSQVINDRPLTTMTADPDDLIPLTPAHFMRDLPVSFPEGGEIGARFYRQSYRKIQDLKQALQARFRKEYLGFLTSRSVADLPELPAIGTIVLVGDNNKRRFEWPLGIIHELIPGRDGKSRVAKVWTKKTYLTRTLQRLYPLEVGDEMSRLKLVESTESSGHNVGSSGSGESRVEFAESSESNPEEVTTTRSGRNVKRPLRYGKWNS